MDEAYETVFNYLPFSRNGNILCLAGQIPKTGNETIYKEGRVGKAVSLEDAEESARIAANQALAWIEKETGNLASVQCIMRLVVYIAVDEDFEQLSLVADAASEILINAFKKRGRHPRSVIGVSRLPRNSPVLLELTVAVVDNE